MAHCVRTFSVKKDTQLTRIYQTVKFPQAKRNFSQCEGKSKMTSPNNYRYESLNKGKKSPQYSFGKEKKGLFRSNKKAQKERYDNYEQIKIRTQSKFQVSKSCRNDTQSTKDMVGVHSNNFYRESVRMKKLVRFSQQNRSSIVSDMYQTPGPFQYHVEPNKNLTYFGKFDKEKRMSLKLAQVPGVGQYSIELYQQRHSPHAKFPAQRGRQKLFKPIEGPGPASYTSCVVEKYKTHSRSTSISFCKQKRPFEIDKKLTPGPGDYDVEEKKSTSPTSFNRTFYSKQYEKFNQTSSFYKPALDLTVEKSRTARFRKKNEINSPKTSKHHDQKEKEKKSMNSTGFAFPYEKKYLN